MKKSIKSIIISVLSLLFIASVTMFLNFTVSVKAEIVQPENKLSVYQLAPENQSLMQSYVIKTPNGKIIVVDGGIDGTGKTANPYLDSAIRAILGLNQTDAFEIDAWFISHAHGDHYLELTKLLENYNANSNFTVKNFYFDFPADFNWAPVNDLDAEAFARFKEGLDNYATVNGIDISTQSYYDQLNGSVINATAIANGLTLTVDGVNFEILQTWAGTDGQINDNSLVFKMVYDEQSVMFLNDIAVNAGNRLVNTYADSPEVLKADVVQMAHHGQNGADKNVYDAIGATAHLWATPNFVWNDTTGTYPIDTVRGWVGATTTADENNLVAGVYANYPADPTSVESWKACVEEMKMDIPHYQTSFFSVVGASMRLTEGSTGIRFHATLSEYDSEAEYGFVIVPRHYLTVNSITSNYIPALIDEYGEEGIILLNSAVNKVGAHYEIYGGVANIKYNNLNLDFVGIPYSLKDGVYTYANFDLDDVTRSVMKVAVNAKNAYLYKNDDSPELVEGMDIIDGFINSAINQKNGVLEENDQTTTPAVTFEFAQSQVDFSTIGETKTLQMNSTFDLSSVVFTSADESIATVSNGKVTMKKLGETTITAKCVGYTASCTVSLSIDVESGYLAQFDSVSYEGLVTGHTASGPYAPSSIVTEHVTSFNGEPNALKVQITNNNVAAGFGFFELELPTACTTGMTVRYFIESTTCPDVKFMKMYDATTSGGLSDNLTSFGSWQNIYLEYTSHATAKNKVLFRFYNATGSNVSTIYFAYIMDGDKVSEIEQSGALSSAAATLADGYLADFSSSLYEGFVSSYNSDYGTISEAKYLSDFAGEPNVLKVTVNVSSSSAGFMLTLPKAMTNGTMTFRYYLVGISSGAVRIRNNPVTSDLANLETSTNKWTTISASGNTNNGVIYVYGYVPEDATMTIYLSAIADGNVVDKVNSDAQTEKINKEVSTLADGYLADFDNDIYASFITVANDWGAVTGSDICYDKTFGAFKVELNIAAGNFGLIINLPKAMTDGTYTLRYYLADCLNGGTLVIRDNGYLGTDLVTIKTPVGNWNTISVSNNTDRDTIYMLGYVGSGTSTKFTLYLSAVADGNVIDKVNSDVLVGKLSAEASTLTDGYLADFDSDVYCDFAMVSSALYRNANSITSEIVDGGFEGETNVLKVTTTNNDLGSGTGIGDIVLKLPKACTTGMTVKIWVGDIGSTQFLRFLTPGTTDRINDVDIAKQTGWQTFYLNYTGVEAKDEILIMLQGGKPNAVNEIYFAFVMDGDMTGAK